MEEKDPAFDEVSIIFGSSEPHHHHRENSRGAKWIASIIPWRSVALIFSAPEHQFCPTKRNYAPLKHGDVPDLPIVTP
jgi:hypothetical protein